MRFSHKLFDLYTANLFYLVIYSFISSNTTTAIVTQKNDENGHPTGPNGRSSESPERPKYVWTDYGGKPP